MAEESDHEKQDIAELARNAADAVASLAVEVGHLVMEGIRSAWDSARADDAGKDAGETTSDADSGS